LTSPVLSKRTKSLVPRKRAFSQLEEEEESNHLAIYVADYFKATEQ
jgi:hypothetical protein